MLTTRVTSMLVRPLANSFTLTLTLLMLFMVFSESTCLLNLGSPVLQGTVKTSLKDITVGTHSCNEARKTLLVYSNNSDVLDRIRASVLGLLNAKAVPMDD